MRVHNPRFGDVADRLSVLRLKIGNARSKGLPTSHFEDEISELSQYCDDKWGLEEIDKIRAASARLYPINKGIWDGVDLQHDLSLPDDEYAKISKEVLRLNDMRGDLVQEMNEEYHPESGKEKIPV